MADHDLPAEDPAEVGSQNQEQGQSHPAPVNVFKHLAEGAPVEFGEPAPTGGQRRGESGHNNPWEPAAHERCHWLLAFVNHSNGTPALRRNSCEPIMPDPRSFF